MTVIKNPQQIDTQTVVVKVLARGCDSKGSSFVPQLTRHETRVDLFGRPGSVCLSLNKSKFHARRKVKSETRQQATQQNRCERQYNTDCTLVSRHCCPCSLLLPCRHSGVCTRNSVQYACSSTRAAFELVQGKRGDKYIPTTRQGTNNIDVTSQSICYHFERYDHSSSSQTSDVIFFSSFYLSSFFVCNMASRDHVVISSKAVVKAEIN